MPTIRYSVKIAASPEKVYAALTEEKQLTAWWSSGCKTRPVIGGQATFSFGNTDNKAVFEIKKLEPEKLIEWYCTDHKFAALSDWIGTTVRFELCPESPGTLLKFSQENWKDKEGCFEVCEERWGHFITVSLKKFLETGVGEPFRDDNPDEVRARAVVLEK